MGNKIIVLVVIGMLALGGSSNGTEDAVSPETGIEITPVTRYAISQLNQQQDTLSNKLDTAIVQLRQLLKNKKK